MRFISLMTNIKSVFMHKMAEKETETMNQNAMSLNLKLMYVAAIAVPPSVKANTYKMTAYVIYAICYYAVYFPILLGQILALYHFWGDMDICTNNIFTLLGGIVCYTEATYVRFNSREIVELFQTFQNKVVTKMSTVGFQERKKEIFDSATKKARRITLIVMIILDVMVAAWIPAPFIKHLTEEHNNVTNNEIVDDKKWLNFCYIIWFPTDITVSPYFEIMYLLQCILFIFATTYLKAIDITIGAMMVHISAQFEILYTALQDIDMILSVAEEKKKKKNTGESRFVEPAAVNMCVEDSDKRLVTGVGTPAERGPQEWKTTYVRGNFGNTDTKHEDLPEPMCYLANFVQYHQAVIDFTADVNKAFGPVFLISFSTRQFLACVMSFQVALTWGQDNNNNLKFIFGFVTAMCQPMIFCWYGTAIIHNSQAIQRAAYEGQWYRYSKTMKQHLQMIVARSQKAVHLSACQFYVISLQTFGKMINAIYAYFTLLKNQYEN